MNVTAEKMPLLTQYCESDSTNSVHYFSISCDGMAENALESATISGRHLDTETGLHYFRARYYDDEMGRFIGRDPIGYHDGMNLYSGYFVPNKLDWNGKRVEPGNQWSTRLPTVEGWTAGNPYGDTGWVAPERLSGLYRDRSRLITYTKYEFRNTHYEHMFLLNGTPDMCFMVVYRRVMGDRYRLEQTYRESVTQRRNAMSIAYEVGTTVGTIVNLFGLLARGAFTFEEALDVAGDLTLDQYNLFQDTILDQVGWENSSFTFQPPEEYESFVERLVGSQIEDVNSFYGRTQQVEGRFCCPTYMENFNREYAHYR